MKKKILSVNKKLTGSYIILMAMMVIIAGLAVFGISALNSSVKTLVSQAEAANLAMKVSSTDINVAARNVREMALNDDATADAVYKQNFINALNDVDEQLKTIKESGVVEDATYQQYVTAITNWANDAYSIVETMEAGDIQQATELIFTKCVTQLDELENISDSIDAQIEATVSRYSTRSLVTYRVCAVIIVLSSLIGVAFAIYICRAMPKSIIEPLNKIEQCTYELAEGNLHTDVAYSADDELGHMADHLREAIATLSSYIEDISNAMGEFANGNFTAQPSVEWKGDFLGIRDSFEEFELNIAETITGINKVANQVEMSAKQVSASSMEIANGAVDQASVVEEFTATIENVSSQVASNAEYTKGISAQVEKVGDDVAVMTGMMNDMVDTMNEIEQSSNKIMKIIDTISDVASQTRLLALNASIEAARAGEAGRGFAVVANQVTALAAQTAAAVDESAKLIENSIEGVSKGMKITEEISKHQSAVAADTQNIVNEVSNIAEALEAQKESFVQLSDGVNMINNVVQDNSATSQQCAANSQDMNSQADTLGSLIEKFKVVEANVSAQAAAAPAAAAKAAS